MIKGYDAWKTRSPEDDADRFAGRSCPLCGARRPEDCGAEEEGEDCQWREPDPDERRDEAFEEWFGCSWYGDDDDYTEPNMKRLSALEEAKRILEYTQGQLVTVDRRLLEALIAAVERP